jgi:oligo-1,6-glucosidase
MRSWCVNVYSFCLYLTAAADSHSYMAISAAFQTMMNKCSRTFLPLRISSALVLLNFKKTAITFSIDSTSDWTGFRLVLESYENDEGEEIEVASNEIRLRGFEGRVYKITIRDDRIASNNDNVITAFFI